MEATRLQTILEELQRDDESEANSLPRRIAPDSLNRLALAWCERVHGDLAENSDKAIRAFEQLLEPGTPVTDPVERAMVRINLGTVYGRRVSGDRASDLERAIAELHRALEILTPEETPDAWANAMTNLAFAYSRRRLGDRQQNIARATDLSHQVLEVITRSADPAPRPTYRLPAQHLPRQPGPPSRPRLCGGGLNGRSAILQNGWSRSFMETQRTLQGLIRIWHELPRLVGTGWLELYPKVRDLLSQILTCEDPVERHWLVVDVLDVLRPHEAASKRLEDVRNALGMEPGKRGPGDPQPTPIPEWSELGTGVEHRLEPEVTARYTDVTAPRRLPRTKRGAVTVGLTREPQLHGERTELLTVPLDQTLEVHLMALSPGLEVLRDSVKELVVEEDSDTEPVVFFIMGHELGTKDLRIEFRQDGLSLASIPLTVEICEVSESEEQTVIPKATLEAGGIYAPPPDLDFRVVLHEEGTHLRFHYVLHSPNRAVDFNFFEIVGPRIEGSVKTYREKLVSTLDQFARGRDQKRHPQKLTPVQIRSRMEGIGEQLFDDLLPGELRRICSELMTSPVRTLQITTDEPWIPWELLKPDIEDGSDEAFWCGRFQLTRWLAGRVGQTRGVRVEHLACIEAAHAVAEKPLAGAEKDRRYLTEMTHGGGVEVSSLENATLEEVEELLDQGGIDLWHFAAHGIVDLEETDPTVIHLRDWKVLRASDLNRQRQRKIAEKRPLVFLNVCSAGQQGRALTGLGGWVQAWVARSRCGVLIAPLCSVDDHLAHLFSHAFYEALRRGETVGQAALRARHIVNEERPEDPTWLAYSVYAHPNARVLLPPVEDPVDSSDASRGL